jgi:hypothetical protein
MIENIGTRMTRVAAALVVPALMSSAAFAAPQVNVKSERFVTAREKNAVKVFLMKEGYKGDLDAKALGEKIFRTKARSEGVSLKDDGSNHMLYVSKDDPSAHFRIDKTTGDISWSRGMKAYLNDGATAGLPGKNSAVDVAKRHLTELGLMPADQKQLVVRSVGGVRQADLGADGKSVEHDKLVTVFFGRVIDGIDVGGPGSKIIVELGASGELVSLIRRWSEVNEEKKADGDVQSQADVTKSLREKLQRDGSNARTIDSSGPDFGYFDDGKGHIEPAYFFTADLTYDVADEKGVVTQHNEKHGGAVPALKGSKADFEQLEKAKAQPLRSVPRTEDMPSKKDH